MTPQISENILDLRLNHSNAEEATEDPTLSESMFRTGNISGLSFEENQFADNVASSTIDSGSFVSSGPMSPTIPIPTSSSSKRNKFDTIDCEIGSKKSTDGSDFLASSGPTKTDDETLTRNSTSSRLEYSEPRTPQDPYKISDLSAESLIWLSHRLGPVLTARHLTRNLLKMLTLCYVGQENLIPDYGGHQDDGSETLSHFTVAEGQIVGDRNALKVLECLTSITGSFDT